MSKPPPLDMRSDEEAGVLAVENRRLAMSIVSKVFRNANGAMMLPLVGSIEDAEQIAMEALFIACKRWDSSRFKLATYATRCIWGTLKSAIRDGGLIRAPRYKECSKYAEQHNQSRRFAGLEYAQNLTTRDSDDPARIGEERDLHEHRMTQADVMLKRIPERWREAFVGRYRDEKPLHEIADILGVSRSRAGQMIILARKALQKQAKYDRDRVQHATN